ncbi:MAG: ATP-binding protein [Candidatus Gastranaerophilaceae bacterium]
MPGSCVVVGLSGAAIGAVGGAITYFKDKRKEKEIAKLEAEQKKLDDEKKKVEKQQQQLRELQAKADGKIRKSLEEATIALAEAQRLNEINSMYNTKALQEIKDFGLGKIAGYKQDKLALNKAFISPFLKSMENSEIYEKVPNGVLLYGLSGNGKTTMALALAEQVLGDKVTTNFYNLSNKNGEKVVAELEIIKEKASNEFEETRQRTIVFIDEFDGIALENGINGYNGSVNGQLKTFLNDCANYGITVVATTNHPRNIEEAFTINKKRFNVQTVIEPPTKEDIKDIVSYYLNGIADDTVKYGELADEIDKKANEKNGKYTCSAIETIAKEAKNIGKSKKRLVTQKDLLEIINDSGPDLNSKSFAKFKDDFLYMSKGMSYDEYLTKNDNKR